MLFSFRALCMVLSNYFLYIIHNFAVFKEYKKPLQCLFDTIGAFSAIFLYSIFYIDCHYDFPFLFRKLKSVQNTIHLMPGFSAPHRIADPWSLKPNFLYISALSGRQVRISFFFFPWRALFPYIVPSVFLPAPGVGTLGAHPAQEA